MNETSIENEKKAKLFDFYKSVMQSNQLFSVEELELAIEALKMVQQTVKNNSFDIELQNNTESTYTETTKADIPKTEESEENKTLTLPSYDWFVTTQEGKRVYNIFTGSRRKDATKGIFSTTTFNYKIYVSDEGKTNAKIMVSCFLEKPWCMGAVREDICKTEHQCSAFGLTEALVFLNEEWQKFREDNKIE